MKKIFLAFLCVFTSGMAAVVSAAEKNDLPDWQNPYVLERNREPMVSHFETDGLKQTLNGMWDFCWYETIDSRSMDFYRTDFDASGWDQMPVPGLWEMNGAVMGGPFVSHVRVDEKNQRVIVSEAFVYSPGRKKRDIMRRMEAALYTLVLPGEEVEASALGNDVEGVEEE